MPGFVAIAFHAPSQPRIAVIAGRQQRAGQCIGHAQARPALAVDGHLTCAADATEIPVVGPIAAVNRQAIAVLAQRGPPLRRRRQADTRRLASRVPFVDEFNKALKGRAVVAKGMVRLDHQNGQVIADLRQSFFDPRPPRPLKLLLIPPDAKTPAVVVGPAVPGQQFTPAGPLPPESIGPLERIAAEVGVDGHAEGVDAGIQQHVRPAASSGR